MITATQLENWADAYQSGQVLEELVQRLIWATAIPGTSATIPGTSATTQTAFGRDFGADLWVQAHESTAFCPRGLSIWEVTSAGDMTRRFQRVQERARQQGVKSRETTFVAVTARRFSARADWMRRARGPGVWRDVVLYDADDLARWLQQAPAVSVWFATEHLGILIDGVRAFEPALTRWSQRTEPALPKRLLQCGRARAADDVVGWLVQNQYSGPADSIVLLVDEIDAHLHPRWQRTILDGLRAAMDEVSSDVQVQLIASTHSPLVTASLEPRFDEDRDGLYLFDIDDAAQGVQVRLDSWYKRGDALNWLLSEVFGLRQARSLAAERAIDAAQAWMRGERDGLPPDLASEEAIHREL